MATTPARLWWRRPLFVLAAGLAAITALDHFEPQLVWVGGVLLALLVAWQGGWKAGLVSAALAVIVLGNGRMRDARQAADELHFAGLGLQSVTARLVEDANGENGKWSGIARLHGKETGRRKVRWVGNGEPPPAGTELRASGIFEGLGEERNPGTPDRAQRLRNEGVVAVFRANGMRSEKWIGPVSQWAAGVKKSFREGIVAGLEEESPAAKVIRAVVLGERAKDSLGLVRKFRESGTLHVFTVSGMHVMMLGSMVWFALKWSGISRRMAIPMIIAAMFGYAWLTGNGPAAVRAAWMGAVFLGGFAFRRRTDLLNALGVVLIVSLLWDPRMMRMPGVQLSYGVVAAIGIGTGLARRCFAWIAAEEEFLPSSELGFWQMKWLGFRRKVAESLAVSTAASVGSLPLAAFHFGIVAPISVIATVALVPMVYVLLAVALVSALLHPFWEGASVSLNRGNSLVAGACAETAGLFAGMPGASFAMRPRSEESLVIYDLGYGASAACFASGAGNSVLIDAGGDFSLEREVGPSLMKLGLRPDSVMFTHADAGHVASPELMLEMFPMRQAASGVEPASGSIAAEWESPAPGGIRMVHPAKGDLIDLGGGAWGEVLLSTADGFFGSIADDRALVVRMHWKGWTLLWVGDSGRLTEEALLSSGMDLKSDVIIASIHESDLSLGDAFLASVDPKLIVLPRPAGCEMDALRVLQKKSWMRKGIRFLDQRETGGITVTADDAGELTFRGFLDGSETRLRKE
jgi:competence protein ComEC